MDIEVKCNHCNNFYDVDEAHIGQEIDCPDCGKIFIITPHKAEATKPAEPSPSAETEEGLLLGLYQMEGEVAEGGMGKVFKVHHTGWNVDLAMKQPHGHMFETEAQKQTFAHECEAWINLGLHPHIVSCYYVREINGVPNIFAEWMEGGDLAHWIESRQLYEGDEKDILERILDIAIQFAWGLDYAHENGLIHQDVKPENVMLTPEGDVKIADFGIANAICGIANPNAETVQFGGTMISDAGAYTPAYCSPEQANGGKLTRRTDIWSWAISVMEMFTVERLWDVGSVAGIACDEYFEQAQVPIPESIKELLQECFQGNESERPKNFKVITDQLLEIYKHISERNYERTFPKAASDSPDSLNNRALSYKDMGMPEKAEELWEKALQLDPHHLDSTYNHGLRLWRTGRIDDLTFVKKLEEVRKTHTDSWRDEYLLGLIHIERRDAEGAIGMLELAKEQSNGDRDVEKALSSVKKNQGNWGECQRTFKGHSTNGVSVAFSPNGKYCLSGSNGLKLWDFKTGLVIREFGNNTNSVYSVAFSNNGNYCLSGHWDATINLWEVESGKCIRTFKGHCSLIWSVAFHPDEKICVSGGDSTVKFWEIETGECKSTFEGHSTSVHAVTFSPDGLYCLSGSGNGTMKLCDVKTGKDLRNFEAHSGGNVNSLTFTKEGKYCLSGCDDRTLALSEVMTGKCLRVFEGHKDVVASIAISPDGRYCLSASWDRTLKLWLIETGQCIRTFNGHNDHINSARISMDGLYFLSGSSDTTMKLWSLNGFYDSCNNAPDILSKITSSIEMRDLESQYQEMLKNIEYCETKMNIEPGLVLIEQTRNLPGRKRYEDIMLWKHKFGKRCKRTSFKEGWFKCELNEHSDEVKSIAFSPNGQYCVSGSADKTMKLWEIFSGKCLQTFNSSNWVNTVNFSPDGNYFISGSGEGELKLWEEKTRQCLRIFDNEEHENPILSLAFSPDGRNCLSGGGEKNTLKLWNIETGKCSRIYDDLAHYVFSVAFSCDGRLCLLGSSEKPIMLLELKTGKCLREFEGHSNWVRSVAFSPDANFFLSGSWDKTMKLWNVANGQCLNTFEGHEDKIWSVAFSPDGCYGLSGSADNTMKLWEIESGICLHTFEGHSDGVTSVAFSPDGRYGLSGSADNTLKIWEFDWEYEFPGWSDWNDGVEPYLRNFLTLRNHQWNEEDFNWLINDLQNRGFGWLRPEGVRKKLEEMSK